METKGIEQSLLTTPKTPISETRGAKSGALKDENDSNLARLIEVWPTLPEHTKSQIKDLVEKHFMEGNTDGSKTKEG